MSILIVENQPSKTPERSRWLFRPKHVVRIYIYIYNKEKKERRNVKVDGESIPETR